MFWHSMAGAEYSESRIQKKTEMEELLFISSLFPFDSFQFIFLCLLLFFLLYGLERRTQPKIVAPTICLQLIHYSQVRWRIRRILIVYLTTKSVTTLLPKMLSFFIKIFLSSWKLKIALSHGWMGLLSVMSSRVDDDAMILVVILFVNSFFFRLKLKHLETFIKLGNSNFVCASLNWIEF